jgi:hypothetical protein
MLFRTATGDLIIINKYDYVNDRLYYEKIMELKKPFSELLSYAKLKKTFQYKNNK